VEEGKMKVYVKTPARLHFGLIDLNGNLGRLFGGLGLAIDAPNVILEAEPSQQLTVTGENAPRVEALAKRFLQAYHIQGNAKIHVKEVIPDHIGLGSGTQLSLAVAVALAKLFNQKASIQELSLTMGRAQRTGVGTAVFEQGGFVVDGGKLTQALPNVPNFPPLIFRQAFPENWRLIVGVPSVKKGLADEEEKSAFKQLPTMSAEEAGKACRVIVMKMLPAIKDQDIQSFGEALTAIQAAVGDNFADVQGGRYSSSAAAEGIAFLRKIGAYGVGQSSWGPAFYGLFKEENAAEAKKTLQAFLKRGVGGKAFVAKANNKGAYIKVTN
jgi:beta-ribofuranosylaminobenzene 5'-phosphate synthase